MIDKKSDPERQIVIERKVADFRQQLVKERLTGGKIRSLQHYKQQKKKVNYD